MLPKPWLPLRWPLLAIVLASLTGCGAAPSEVARCPVPLVSYTQDQQDRVAEEMTEAAGAAVWPSFIVDYALLRNEVRACQRASQ